MTQVLHKTFADEISGGGGTGFTDITETNGTVVRSDTAGLNGTTFGALFSATGASPGLFGRLAQTIGAATVWRTAWYTDVSGVTIGTDTHETRLFHHRNDAGTLNPTVLYLEKESGALRFRFRVFTDSTNISQFLAATLLPAWVEVRELKESFDGAADGEVQFYFGGGDYPAGGQLVAEFTNLDNFGQFGPNVFNFGLFQSEASVGGAVKVDEIFMRNDDTPILVNPSTDTPYAVAGFIATADSEEASDIDGGAANVLGTDTSKVWHTDYSTLTPGHPHSLMLDMGEVNAIKGFLHLPLLPNPSGHINAYRFYSKINSGTPPSTPIVLGEWALHKDDVLPNTKALHEISVTEASSRYVLWVSDSTHEGHEWASMNKVWP